MQNINIFIGSDALLWASKTTGEQILIGNSKDHSKHTLDVTLDLVPESNYQDNIDEELLLLAQMKFDFKEFINSIKPSHSKAFVPILEKTKNLSVVIFTKSVGLFSVVTTCLTADFLAQHKLDFSLEAISPNYPHAEETYEFMTNYLIDNHPTQSVKLVLGLEDVLNDRDFIIGSKCSEEVNQKRIAKIEWINTLPQKPTGWDKFEYQYN